MSDCALLDTRSRIWFGLWCVAVTATFGFLLAGPGLTTFAAYFFCCLSGFLARGWSPHSRLPMDKPWVVLKWCVAVSAVLFAIVSGAFALEKWCEPSRREYLEQLLCQPIVLVLVWLTVLALGWRQYRRGIEHRG